MERGPVPAKIDFAVGGQAVIEGVMMRSPNFVTVAVRKAGGTIILKDQTYRSLSMRLKLFGIPLIRGVVNLVEMMVIGMRMLNFSAAEMMDEEANPSRKEKESVGQKALLAISFAISIIFALGMSLFLFKFLPLFITDFLSREFSVLNENYLLYNVVDGIIKTSFFIVYIALLGLLPSLHRVFQYHGAEHKSIYTYEKKLSLNVENARKMKRFHPRCGTSFILVVFMLSIFIYTFIPRQPDFWINFLVRVAFLPLVAGVSYELLKWSARHAEHSLVRIITFPGLLFQRITTQEPTDDQLEVALSALRKALELEEQKSQPETIVDVS
jgi:uncharacterized protein YqhQ